MSAAHTFRAIWPVTDMTVPLGDLIAAALEDLPDVASRAHAHITGRPRFSLAPASRVPGSGNTTENVLVLEAAAEPLVRPYHLKVTA